MPAVSTCFIPDVSQNDSNRMIARNNRLNFEISAVAQLFLQLGQGPDGPFAGMLAWGAPAHLRVHNEAPQAWADLALHASASGHKSSTWGQSRAELPLAKHVSYAELPGSVGKQHTARSVQE